MPARACSAMVCDPVVVLSDERPVRIGSLLLLVGMLDMADLAVHNPAI